jgi:hypothetical protein
MMITTNQIATTEHSGKLHFALTMKIEVFVMFLAFCRMHLRSYTLVDEHFKQVNSKSLSPRHPDYLRRQSHHH